MPEGWRDTSPPTFLHFLAPDVASDPVAERWADVLIYEATSVIDPTTGEQQPLSDDVTAWLRANPTMDVLDEGTVQVGGRSAVRQAEYGSLPWAQDGQRLGGRTVRSAPGQKAHVGRVGALAGGPLGGVHLGVEVSRLGAGRDPNRLPRL
jgi:hypothetical protein